MGAAEDFAVRPVLGVEAPEEEPVEAEVEPSLAVHAFVCVYAALVAATLAAAAARRGGGIFLVVGLVRTGWMSR